MCSFLKSDRVSCKLKYHSLHYAESLFKVAIYHYVAYTTLLHGVQVPLAIHDSEVAKFMTMVKNDDPMSVLLIFFILYFLLSHLPIQESPVEKIFQVKKSKFIPHFV